MSRSHILGIILCLPAFACSRLSSLAWPALSRFEPWLSLLLTPLLAACFLRLLHLYAERLSLEHFLLLSEYLSARISAGTSLELCLLEAGPSLHSQLGRHSKLGLALHRTRQRLLNQMSLNRTLELLIEEFPCPEAQSFLGLLPFISQKGAQLDHYVRQSHRQLTAQNLLEKEIRAEQSGKQMEALILLTLPFISAAFLHYGSASYSSAWTASSLAPFVSLLIFLSAWCAVFISLKLLLTEHARLKTPQLKIPGHAPSFCYLLADRLLSYDPFGLHFYLAETSRRLSPQHSCTAWPHYLYRILTFLLLIPLGLAALSCPSGQSLGVILCLAAFLPIWQLYSSIRLLQAHCRLLYPDFIAVMSILLASGLTLQTALKLYRERLRPGTVLQRDLSSLEQDIHSGHTAAYALGQLARHIPQNEIASALQLMARYERDGGSEIIRLLERSGQECQVIYRQAYRKRLAEKHVLLLLPMAFDLLLILLSALFPALSSFQLLAP